MQLTYENTRTNTTKQLANIDIHNLKSPLTLFKEFYTQQNNQDLNTAQNAILEELIHDIWEEK